ncbi:hypothetical protein B0T13DRAFT_477667 [Neurospora crassa]|nr:hypothetical protein B0T13DRAFT_477667 [Neurospora crassa]
MYIACWFPPFPFRSFPFLWLLPMHHFTSFHFRSGWGGGSSFQLKLFNAPLGDVWFGRTSPDTYQMTPCCLGLLVVGWKSRK